MEDYVVVLCVQGQAVEAQVRGFLEAHGIATDTRGETLRRTHGISLDGLGEVQILVPREQADAARELLARAERGEFTIGVEGEESPGS